jgi:predicted nucleic acid-binding protein
MTRVALDSNILIYAKVEPETKKGKRASSLILRAARDGIIPAQVLGEYLRFFQRRAPQLFDDAIELTAMYRKNFLIPVTTGEIVARAAALASAHQLQLWDAVLCTAATLAGAKVLLSEDMQDGRVLDGLRIVNPLEPANDAAIDAIFEG